jgi:signal peptidase II
MAPKTRLFLLALAAVLPLDQLTKHWIVRGFYYGEVLPVVPGWLDLTHVRNPGGAFSFFADGDPQIRIAFFVGTSLVAIGMLLIFFLRLPRDSRWTATALGAVLGGAIGNLIDRLVFGEVIDWIDVHITATYTWPTFNIADSCIVVGVIVLLVETFFEEASDGAGETTTAEPQS